MAPNSFNFQSPIFIGNKVIHFSKSNINWQKLFIFQIPILHQFIFQVYTIIKVKFTLAHKAQFHWHPKHKNIHPKIHHPKFIIIMYIIHITSPSIYHHHAKHKSYLLFINLQKSIFINIQSSISTGIVKVQYPLTPRSLKKNQYENQCIAWRRSFIFWSI